MYGVIGRKNERKDMIIFALYNLIVYFISIIRLSLQVNHSGGNLMCDFKRDRRMIQIRAKISPEFMADERPWCMCINCDVIE